MAHFDVLVVGAGILGTSISYFLAHMGRSVGVAEQAHGVAAHTSGRNTGKVHAPYLYDPQKKRLFASAAFHGYGMWKEYAELRGLPFRRDGVIEVATEPDETRVLQKYLKWARRNGLEDSDIELVDREEMRRIEPEIRCESALCVHRDASADYAKFTESLMRDSAARGARFLFDARVVHIRKGDRWHVDIGDGRQITADFVINAAGGMAVDIAHGIGLGTDLVDVHFRGEYWKAPDRYRSLTSTSVYCVPRFPEYPFLDPHWIVRVDGSCEIGPNAVPVFSPYGYDTSENIKEFVPKVLEMLGSGAKKTLFDKRFQELAMGEIRSSVSKSAMVDRVRRFLPKVNPEHITERGTAGIRSSVIDGDGRFVPDVILLDGESSLHILNYNSPGATGALPFSAHVIDRLSKSGMLEGLDHDAACGPWRFSDIVERMDDGAGREI